MSKLLILVKLRFHHFPAAPGISFDPVFSASLPDFPAADFLPDPDVADITSSVVLFKSSQNDLNSRSAFCNASSVFLTMNSNPGIHLYLLSPRTNVTRHADNAARYSDNLETISIISRAFRPFTPPS